MNWILNLIWLCFFMKGLSFQCIWPDMMGFDKGPVMTVNATAHISVQVYDEYTQTLVYWFLSNDSTNKILSGYFTDDVFTYTSSGTENINASFSLNGSLILSTLTINQLEHSYNGQNISFGVENCRNPRSKGFEMSVQYCSDKSILLNQMNQNISVHADNSPSSYQYTGQCSCSGVNGTLRYNNGNIHPKIAICNETAQWNGCENAECWFDPTNVVVSQHNKFEGNPANLSCRFDVGFPLETSIRYELNSLGIGENEILRADNYGQSLRCIVNNTKFPGISSDPESVIVFFVPQDLTSTESLIHIPMNESSEVSFQFRAHANNDNMTTEFYMSLSNGSKKCLQLTNTTKEYGYYVFRATIEIASEEDYGEYTFFVETFNPDGNLSSTIEVVEENLTTIQGSTLATADLPIAALIGVCCVVVLIIILVIFLIWYRKHRSNTVKGAVKEERDNPLYGTSDCASSRAKYAVVNKKDNSKEERVNPIYASSGAGPVEEAYAVVDNRKKIKKENNDNSKEERVNPIYASSGARPVEEAYAVVDNRKKIKKENKGNENAAYSTENTNVVYAAVNKPKKEKNDLSSVEAVYTEVNKKKK